jgi:hypothetical protein
VVTVSRYRRHRDLCYGSGRRVSWAGSVHNKSLAGVANGFAFDLTSYPDITELQASTVHAGSTGCHGTTDWRAATAAVVMAML